MKAGNGIKLDKKLLFLKKLNFPHFFPSLLSGNLRRW
jgi:hypothetical protein